MVASNHSLDTAGWDFFISYTDADRAWAEWVAWQLPGLLGAVVYIDLFEQPAEDARQTC